MRNDTQKVMEAFHLTFSSKEKKIIETAEESLPQDEYILYLAIANLSIVTGGKRRIHVAPDTLFVLTDRRVYLRQPGVFKPMIDDIPLGVIQSAESREDSENAGHLLITASGKSYDIMLALSRELREKVLEAFHCAMENNSKPEQESAITDTAAMKTSRKTSGETDTSASESTDSNITQAEPVKEEITRADTIKTAHREPDHASAKPKNYRYFSHKECEYFPCHKGADPDNFNCLFCYCPFYLLGDQCGGNFRYLSTGTKDCTNCLYPHLRENYDEITARYQDIKTAMPCPRRNSPE